MDNQQISELTYMLVDEINKKTNDILDGLTEVNPENSTTLKILTTSVKTDTQTLIDHSNNNSANIVNIKATVDNTKTDIENLNGNLTTLSEENTNIYNTVLSNSEKLDNLLNGESGGSDETNNETLTNIETNLNEITTTINTISNNVTTINSNTATTNNNVTTIKTDVKDIKENLPTSFAYKTIDNKLNEIISVVKRMGGEEDFKEDPFKLNMPYNGKIETDRNPSNYDFFEITEEYEGKNILNLTAVCDDPTFNYNFEITCSCTNSFSLYLNFNSDTNYKRYSAGTYTINLNKENVTIVDNKICCNFYSTWNLTIHHIKLELWGKNILIVPKKRKFKVHNSLDKICITKTENNKGYYMVLDNINALTPDKINKDFILYKTGVLDYDMGFNIVKIGNRQVSLGDFHVYADLNYVHNFSLEKENGTITSGTESGYYYPACESSVYADKIMYSMHVLYNNQYTPTFYYLKNDTKITRTRFALREGYASEATKIFKLNDYNKEYYVGYILTDIYGLVHFAFGSTNYIEIGYGKNATAYFDKEDPLKVNIYINDGGYCVKKVVTFNEDQTNLQLISQQIIGTYDAYFETNSDVYFVEKDGKLFMFKNGVTNNTETIEENNETE